MALATVDHVTELWAKEPEEGITALIERRLNQVERMLKRRIPDLETKAAADPDYLAEVVDIESDAVLRLVRNPEGYLSETDGDYTYMLQSDLTSGKLEILPEEWANLGIKQSRMFTLVPTISMPT